MGYLQPTDYATFGLPPDTTDDWVVGASALIDSHCRRSSLNATQYTERLRMVEGSQCVRLSYLPLVVIAPATLPLISAHARYARPRRGGLAQSAFTSEIAYAFQLPGSWTELDCTTLDFVSDTGEVVLPYSLLGLPYNEVTLAYTAGFITVPVAVQSACAQLVKNAQSTPSLNVRRAKLDTMEMEYFGSTLLDDQVKALLKPYISNRLG